MFEGDGESRSALGDWFLRGAIAIFFVIFGIEKFSDPGGQWFKLFQQVGAGQWFRYVTGAVEILGGLLVLIPRTAIVGLALLAATMAGAVLIQVFVIGRPADGIFPGIFFLALALVLWNRRSG